MQKATLQCDRLIYSGWSFLHSPCMSLNINCQGFFSFNSLHWVNDLPGTFGQVYLPVLIFWPFCLITIILRFPGWNRFTIWDVNHWICVMLHGFAVSSWSLVRMVARSTIHNCLLAAFFYCRLFTAWKRMEYLLEPCLVAKHFTSWEPHYSWLKLRGRG